MLGFNLLTGRRGGGGARRNTGAALDAEPAFRGATLDAEPAAPGGAGRFRSWADDPPSARRVGRQRAGGPWMALQARDFAALFAFNRASGAADFDPSGALVQLAADAVRQGYDPATLLPAGWLLEGAATNILRQTSPANWSGVAAPNDVVQSAGPNGLDGATASVLLAPGTGNGSHGCWRFMSGGTAATLYAFSVFLKAAGYGFARVGLTNNAFGANAREAVFDLSNGTVATQDADGGARIAPAGNGWWRCTVSATSLASPGANYLASIYVHPTAGTGSFSGDGTSGVLAWGWQVETGPLATSYVPNTTAPATRAADALRLEGAAFASIFGAGAPRGCVVVEARMASQAPLLRTLFQLDAGADADRLQCRPNLSGGSLVGVPVLGGVQGSAPAAAGAMPYGTAFRAGLRWNGGAFAVCLNGGALGTGSGAPASFSALRIGADAAGAALNGRVRRVQALAHAPSDAEFQALCAPGT